MKFFKFFEHIFSHQKQNSETMTARYNVFFQKAGKIILFFCNIAAVILGGYIVFFLFYMAGIDVMNLDAAVNACFAKNIAWGKDVFTECPPYFIVTSGATVLLPVAAGIRIFGNSLAVPQYVMLTVNLLLLMIVLILPFKYHFIEKKYWCLYSLVYLLFYFCFPCSDRAALWFYTPLGELPAVMYIQIAALILFGDFNRERICRRNIFVAGVFLGPVILCKDLGLLPLIVICGSWCWLRCRCFPSKNWRQIAGDIIILLCGILLLPFLWQVLLFCKMECSVTRFWQSKMELFSFFQGSSALQEGFWEHLVSRFSYYRIEDGFLWALFMGFFPLYLAIRFLFVKAYEKRFYAWTLFWAGYSVYCYWLFCEALNHSRHLLMGHIFFVAAAVMFLFCSEKKWLKIFFLFLIVFNPQIHNAFNDLTQFNRQDFLQEKIEAQKAVDFCMAHPDSSFVETGYGLGPYLISYAHPVKTDIIARNKANIAEKTYCILETRYLVFYQEHIPAYAQWLNPDCKFWRIYDFSIPPASTKKNVSGDFDGDGISELLLWHKKSNGDTMYHIFDIKGKEKCSPWVVKQGAGFIGTADSDLDGKEELFFHNRTTENSGLKSLFTVAEKNNYQFSISDVSIPYQQDSAVFAGFWDGHNECFICHHTPSGKLVLARENLPIQTIPGKFSPAWKLVASGNFGCNNGDRLLFFCEQLNRYYFFDIGGNFQEMPINLPLLACGPDNRGHDTVIFELPDKKAVLTMSKKTLSIPSGWRVAAAGYYMPEHPLPQLFLIQHETGKTALRVGEENGTFMPLDWKIEKNCRVWNRLCGDCYFYEKKSHSSRILSRECHF